MFSLFGRFCSLTRRSGIALTEQADQVLERHCLCWGFPALRAYPFDRPTTQVVYFREAFLSDSKRASVIPQFVNCNQHVTGLLG